MNYKLTLSNGDVFYKSSIPAIAMISDVFCCNDAYVFTVKWNTGPGRAVVDFKSKRAASINRNKLLRWIDSHYDEVKNVENRREGIQDQK